MDLRRPGTGKTVVVIESIRQLLASNPAAQILACAPSNDAADEMAERLARGADVDSSVMLRLNAYTRPPNFLPDELRPYSQLSVDGTHFKVPPVDVLKSYRLIICTCYSTSLLFGTGILPGFYSHVFIDEAGHALEPATLIPVLGLADKSTRVVLSGDPMQLGPIVRSNWAIGFGFNQSLLERLMDCDIYTSPSGSYL